MKRYQLIELHEQPWYPKALREIQTEVLDQANHSTGFAKALVAPFAELLEESGASTVLDLCSGAGGPAVLLARALAAEGKTPPKVMLSDLFPNIDKWSALRERYPEWLDFVSEPVNATSLPDHLDGDLITIINSLHHFPIETARSIIGEAVRRGAALFIAEGFPRSIPRATAYLPSLLSAIPKALLGTRNHRLSKVALSLSVLPVTGAWDWLVSALRIHEPAELRVHAARIAPGYTWSHGSAPFPPWGRAVYLKGFAAH